MGLHYFHVKITTTKKHVMMKKSVRYWPATMHNNYLIISMRIINWPQSNF